MSYFLYVLLIVYIAIRHTTNYFSPHMGNFTHFENPVELLYVLPKIKKIRAAPVLDY